MPTACVPDVVVRELDHADVERPVVVDVHVRNEEIFIPLEQEEGSVAVSTEPLAMFLHEPDDLRLSEAQTVEIGRKTVVDLAKGAVLGHLEDRNLLLLGRLTRDIKIPVTEVAIEIPIKGVLGFSDGFGAVRRIKDKRFRSRDEFEVAHDVLRHLSNHPLHETLDFGSHLAT